MRELGDILRALEAMGPGETAVLANVVHVSGSTYRRVGARLLLCADERVIGLISGGCLEGDLVARAAEVRAADAPRLVHYDATAEDDIVWGLGLGCAGVVDVLLEPVAPDRPGPLDWLAAWRRERATGVLATSLVSETLGRRWALHPDGRIEGEPGAELVEAMRLAAANGRAGKVETRQGPVAIEVARPPRRLLIFGAGPDAAPVVRLALELGWSVELVDHRPAQARADRFPGARVHLVPSEEAVARVGVDADTYALVMTHHYLIDRALLAELLPSPAPYLGLLGPRQRAEDLLAELAEQGLRVSAEQRARLRAPAGVDLGGDGPEAIALSLVAEVMAVAEGRSAGWLCDRKGPIHEPGRA